MLKNDAQAFEYCWQWFLKKRQDFLTWDLGILSLDLIRIDHRCQETIFGRRLAYLLCIACLFFFTMGAALARDMPTFIVMRILSGCSGTFFHVCGQTILAEYFPPTQRGTATGFFLSGSVLGPPLGPCIAGIITNFTSWRVLLWLQCVMIGIGFILSACIVPPAKADRGFGLINMPLRKGLAQFNPLPVFKLMKYPNIGFSHLSCGFLSFSQYFLLAAPRQILANEFHMTSPLASGLFYIAPAAGFLLGTVVGGRLSDYTVRSWIIERGGLRLPQDRLNGGIPWLFLVIPPASLIYGWGMELGNLSHHSGGLAFPIVFVFVIAFGQLAAFACLNTYCAEALPRKRREVIAGKYAVQYAFGACACAGAGPLIKVIGVGSACTIAILVLISAVLVWATAKYGLKMQMWAEREQESLPRLSQSQNGKNRQDEHLS
ncbi:synaptic vesicle transporter [Venturia nashicola]|uniref:Synaptic vesicle transporter n=1 Tax=Venturia nashicola TaxID=86259 RepID=A0A4Z1NSG4_9PEZI|nr:synaptic vesicle transporter [Venturia nashicola]